MKAFKPDAITPPTAPPAAPRADPIAAPAPVAPADCSAANMLLAATFPIAP